MAKILCFTLLLAICALSTTTAAAASRWPPHHNKCDEIVIGLAPCSGYAVKGSNVTEPGKDCCKGLAEIAEKSPDCVCHVLSSIALFNVNVTRAFALPEVCSVKLPRDCEGVSPSPSPAPAPAPAPAPRKPSPLPPPPSPPPPPIPEPKKPSPPEKSPSPSPAPASPPAPVSSPPAQAPVDSPPAPTVASPPAQTPSASSPSPMASSSAGVSVSFMAVFGGLAVLAFC